MLHLATPPTRWGKGGTTSAKARVRTGEAERAILQQLRPAGRGEAGARLDGAIALHCKPAAVGLKREIVLLSGLPVLAHGSEMAMGTLEKI